MTSWDAGTVALSIAAFLLGIGIQLVLILRPRRRDVRPLLWIGATALVAGLLPAKNEDTYSIGLHVLLSVVWFALFVAIRFRRRLLPRLHEGGLLVWNCLFVYALLLAYGASSPVTRMGAAIAAVAVLVVVVPVVVPRTVKLLLYGWYLLIVAWLAVLQVRSANASFLSGTDIGEVSPVVAFLDGMAGVYILFHVTYLLAFVPLQSKRQTWAESVEEWREDSGAMIRRFSDAQVDPLLAASIVAVLATAFYANTRSQVMQPWTLVNLLLVTTPWWTRGIHWTLHVVQRAVRS